MTDTSGPRARITPSFVVAILALVMASGGVGYAAGQVTSAQIKDGTIQGRDVRDGTLGGVDVRNGGLTGADVEDRSLAGIDLANGTVARNKLDPACPTGHAAVFGGCVRLVPYSRSSFQFAVDRCNSLNGRLPSIGELRWVASHDEYTWADGNAANYEFSGDFTDGTPLTPLAMRQDGSSISNASAQLFHSRCVVSY